MVKMWSPDMGILSLTLDSVPPSMCCPCLMQLDDGSKLNYISSLFKVTIKPSSLSVISRSFQDTHWLLEHGHGPNGVSVSRDNTKLFVTHFGIRSIVVYDLAKVRRLHSFFDDRPRYNAESLINILQYCNQLDYFHHVGKNNAKFVPERWRYGMVFVLDFTSWWNNFTKKLT